MEVPRCRGFSACGAAGVLLVLSLVLQRGGALPSRHAAAEPAAPGGSVSATLVQVRSTLESVEKAIEEKEHSLNAMRDRHEKSGSRSKEMLDTLDGLERDLEDLREVYKLAKVRVDELSLVMLSKGGSADGAKERDLRGRLVQEQQRELQLEHQLLEEGARLTDVTHKLRETETRERKEVEERDELRRQLKLLKSTLHHMEEVVDDADLSQWIVKHAEILGRVIVDSPEGNRMLEEYVGDFVGLESQLVSTVEQSLEHSLDRVVNHNYSPVLAATISYGLVLAPILLVYHAIRRLVTTLSVRQMVLLVHIFNFGLVVSCLLFCLLLRGKDPLHALLTISQRNLVFLQLVLFVQFPVAVGAMILAAMNRNLGVRSRVLFVVQLFGYTVLALDYRRSVWKPVLRGTDFPPQSLPVFFLYFVVIATMLFLTFSTIGDDDLMPYYPVQTTSLGHKSPMARSNSRGTTPTKES